RRWPTRARPSRMAGYAPYCPSSRSATRIAHSSPWAPRSKCSVRRSSAPGSRRPDGCWRLGTGKREPGLLSGRLQRGYLGLCEPQKKFEKPCNRSDRLCVLDGSRRLTPEESEFLSQMVSMWTPTRRYHRTVVYQAAWLVSAPALRLSGHVA